MRGLQRCRSLGRRLDVTPFRRVLRSAHRSVWRTPVRRVFREVLPYTGPSWREVMAQFNAYCRLVERNPLRHPLQQYQAILEEEKARQRTKADLLRAYGPQASVARQPAAPAKPPPAAPPPVAPPTAPLPCPPQPPSKPRLPPDQKRDLTPVPLRWLPSGFYGCDWDAVRRPSKNK